MMEASFGSSAKPWKVTMHNAKSIEIETPLDTVHQSYAMTLHLRKTVETRMAMIVVLASIRAITRHQRLTMVKEWLLVTRVT